VEVSVSNIARAGMVLDVSWRGCLSEGGKFEGINCGWKMFNVLKKKKSFL
jgi:hypothetical protein